MPYQLTQTKAEQIEEACKVFRRDTLALISKHNAGLLDAYTLYMAQAAVSTAFGEALDRIQS